MKRIKSRFLAVLLALTALVALLSLLSPAHSQFLREGRFARWWTNTDGTEDAELEIPPYDPGTFTNGLYWRTGNRAVVQKRLLKGDYVSCGWCESPKLLGDRRDIIYVAGSRRLSSEFTVTDKWLLHFRFGKFDIPLPRSLRVEWAIRDAACEN